MIRQACQVMNNSKLVDPLEVVVLVARVALLASKASTINSVKEEEDLEVQEVWEEIPLETYLRSSRNSLEEEVPDNREDPQEEHSSKLRVKILW